MRHAQRVATADINLTPPDYFLKQARPLGAGEPPAIIADAIDVRTRDYLSIERSFDPTDAAVLQSMMVQEATGTAVLNTGNRWAEIKIKVPSFAAHVKAEGQRSLQHLADAGDIEYLATDLEEADDWGEVTQRYRNLARGQDRAPQVRTA